MSKSVKKERFQFWIVAADLMWAVLAMGLAYALRFDLLKHGPRDTPVWTYGAALLTTICIWAAIFRSAKLDGFRRGWHLPAIASQLFLAVSFLMVVLFAAGYLFRIFASRLTFACFGLLLFLGFLGIRYLVHRVLSSSLLRRASRRLVIVGSGPVAREMAAMIEKHPEMLCRVVGFLFHADLAFEPPVGVVTGQPSRVPTLEVVNLLREQQVDEVVITLAQPGTPEILNLAHRCREFGIMVSVVPHPYELYLSKAQLLDIGGLPLLQLREGLANFANSPLKRMLDLGLGLLLFAFSVPVVLVGALLLINKRDGPFRRDLRCGLYAKAFMMWRLNSDREAKDL